MKHAQLEHPINWILILFAGFFFLLLFVSIANTVTRSASSTDDIRTIAQTTNTIELTRAAPGTTYEVMFNDLETMCVNNQFSITLRGQNTPLTLHPIFSEEELDGLTRIWSERLIIEKPVTTLTYVLEEGTSIYFSQELQLQQPPLYQYVLSHFPLQQFSENDMPNSFSGSKLIIIGTQSLVLPSDFSLRSGQDIKVLKVQSSSNRDVGRIELNGQTVVYPTKEFLLAAIVSQDANTYRCGVGIAQERISFVTSLSLERTKLLNQSTTNPLCTEFYERAITSYETILNQDISVFTQISDVNDLRNEIQKLRTTNTNLAANNCPQT